MALPAALIRGSVLMQVMVASASMIGFGEAG
jgi:hypothetical protein